MATNSEDKEKLYNSVVKRNTRETKKSDRLVFYFRRTIFSAINI